jgi:tellurite resistance protein TerC
MDRFVYLKLALSFILAFVGIKMLIVEFYKIPIIASLLFIILALGIAMLASILKTKKQKTE